MKQFTAMKPATDTFVIAGSMMFWLAMLMMEVMQNVFFPQFLYQHPSKKK